MYKFVLLALGLLMSTPGLYAMDKQFAREQEAKAQSAATNLIAELTQEDEATDVDQATRELSLLKKQTPEQTEQANKLRDAVRENDIKTVTALLASKTDVNARTTNNNAALRYAFKPETMQLLIDHKANVNSIDSDKRTALHWHCMMASIKDTECIALLVNHPEINVDTQDTLLCTPLYCLLPGELSGRKSTLELIKILLEHDANPNVLFDRLGSILRSDNYFDKKELRVPICKILLTLDDQRKKTDLILAALKECNHGAFPDGPKSTQSIVADYAGCGIRPDDKQLDQLFTEFNWLFKQLKKDGKLS